MLELKSPLAILGLVLSTSGILAGGYLLIERLFNRVLFSTFLTLTPRLLRAFFPYEPTIAWFEIRSNRNLYQSWDIALIYLLLLPIIFSLFIGFLPFFILKVLGVYDLGTAWLSIWFVFLCLNHLWAAVNQHAVEIKAQHRRATVETIKQRMKQDPRVTSKRWVSYFFSNWIKAPFTTLQLLITVVLFVLLHWPAWVIQAFNKGTKLDLSTNETRRNYYIGYMLLFTIIGLFLIFFFN